MVKCDSCNIVFPRLSADHFLTRCAKCEALVGVAAADLQKLEVIKASAQCSECGACSREQVAGQACAACKTGGDVEALQSRQAVYRQQVSIDRLPPEGVAKAKSGAPPPKTTNATTKAYLEDLQASKLKTTGFSLNVTWELQLRQNNGKFKGTTAFGGRYRFPGHTMIDSIHTRIVDHYNKHWWEETHDVALTKENTVLTFAACPGFIPDEETLELDLGRFWALYSDKDTNNFYVPAKHKQSYTLPLLIVVMAEYEERVRTAGADTDVFGDAVSTVAKRARGTSLSVIEPAPAKRGRSLDPSDPLTKVNDQMRAKYLSMLQPQPVRARKAPTKTIRFRKGVYTVIEHDNSFTWFEEAADEIFTGSVETEPFASGVTKHVYHLWINNDHYVAKQLYNVGEGEAPLTWAQHDRYLRGEAIRLKQMALLLDEFQTYAERRAVPIYPYTVMNSFVARLVVDRPAEGEDLPFDYLVEPYVSGPVIRLSGTNEAGANGGLAGTTADAFAHFSVIATWEKLVCSDMEAIKARSMRSNGRDPYCLFDPMIHEDRPVNRWGAQPVLYVGDQGKEGVVRFLDGHTCNLLCVSLHFKVYDTGLMQALEIIKSKRRADTRDTVLGLRAKDELAFPDIEIDEDSA